MVQRKAGVLLVGFLLTVFFAWGFPFTTSAYLMPAEQILDLMSDNFSKFRTLKVSQSVRIVSQDRDQSTITLKENVWVSPSGIIRSEQSTLEGDYAQGHEMVPRNRAVYDSTAEILLVANDKTFLIKLLSRKDIDLDSVAFTRLEGTIAYRIGKEGPHFPKLIVEKERFLPLLLKYKPSDEPSQGMVTVRFEDYRKLSGKWYPYKRVYLVDKEVVEEHIIKEVKITSPLE